MKSSMTFIQSNGWTEIDLILKQKWRRFIWRQVSFKLIEIVILWVDNTTPFGFSLFWYFWHIKFQSLKLPCLAKDQWWGSVPEIRIWSILFIKSDLKWCLHVSRSLILYLITHPWVMDNNCVKYPDLTWQWGVIAVRSYGLDTDIWYMWTVTLTLEIWHWV